MENQVSFSKTFVSNRVVDLGEVRKAGRAQLGTRPGGEGVDDTRLSLVLCPLASLPRERFVHAAGGVAG